MRTDSLNPQQLLALLHHALEAPLLPEADETPCREMACGACGEDDAGYLAWVASNELPPLPRRFLAEAD